MPMVNIQYIYGGDGLIDGGDGAFDCIFCIDLMDGSPHGIGSLSVAAGTVGKWREEAAKKCWEG